MTIRIEIPSDNKPLAAAFGRALSEYAGETTKRVTVTQEEIEKDTGAISDNVVDLNPDNDQGSSGFEELNKEVDLIGEGCSQKVSGIMDKKGVSFIPAVCGEAKDPFYASGPRKGQWKKKRGATVTDAEYDAAYNLALAQVPTQSTPADTGTVTQTAQTQETAEEVFGGGQQQQQAVNTIVNAGVGPQEVFELYSSLLQGGLVNEANGVMQKHGLANGTLIYSKPELAGVIFPELQALSQQGG